MPARLTLTVLGSGDSLSSGGRNQSGYLIEAGDSRLLLDAGVTTLASLKCQRIDPASLDLVVLSHLHGDHLAGLPFLYHEFQQLGSRKTPLRVAGPGGVERKVESIYRAIYPLRKGRSRRFRIEYLSLSPGRRFHPDGPGGLVIVPFRVKHQKGRLSLGYRIVWNGRSLAYSGDTGWFPGLPRCVRGADLFLCECTQVEPESPKHLSLRELRRHRRRFDVGAILLTHLGPDLALRRSIAGFRTARDGMRIRV